MKKIVLLKNQWFGDVIKEFENQKIYNKFITGCGGTTTAIKQGFCIIITPNLSGIISKQEIENVIGVYGDEISYTTMEQKFNQVLSNNLKPVFITTPDSFWRVADLLGNDVYEKYMCIIDEIHCFQEAAGYRKSLPNFIETHLNQFKRKAVITATYVPISHPQFEDWEEIKIVPDFDYQHSIDIYFSDQYLYHSTKDFISKLPTNDKKLIFFNSIKQAVHLDKLGFTYDMLCSKASKDEAIHYREFDGTLGCNTIATSAFFQACDIHEEAHIIFMVDVRNAPHTILSIPQILQALGRCRRKVLSVTMFVKRNTSQEYFKGYDREKFFDSIRNMAYRFLGAAEVIHDDINRQIKNKCDIQIQHILKTYTTPDFQRQLLLYNSDDTFDINWLNIDGEVINREAAQAYYGPTQLQKYLSNDSRIQVDKCESYFVPDGMPDYLLQETQDENKLIKLNKVIDFYREFGSGEGLRRTFWNLYKSASSTSTEQKRMMDICERSAKFDLLESFAKTKGRNDLMKRLETKIIGEESINDSIKLKQEINSLISIGFHTCKSIKEKLQLAYDKHGIQRTAKANEILKYREAKETKKNDERGYVCFCAINWLSLYRPAQKMYPK